MTEQKVFKVSIEERDLVSVFMFGMTGIFSSYVTWNDLMPVCKKCYDAWITYHKENKECADIFENLWSGLWRFDIEEVFEEIVAFIKWYNSQ